MKLDFEKRVKRIKDLNQKIQLFLNRKILTNQNREMRLTNQSCEYFKSHEYQIHPELEHLVPWYQFSYSKFESYLTKLNGNYEGLSFRKFHNNASKITVSRPVPTLNYYIMQSMDFAKQNLLTAL